MVKLVEVYRGRQSSQKRVGYELRQVYVNPSHVMCMYEDESMKTNLREGFLPDNLDNRQSFTRLQLSQGQSFYQISVVGDIDNISEKLGLPSSNRQILHD